MKIGKKVFLILLEHLKGTQIANIKIIKKIYKYWKKSLKSNFIKVDDYKLYLDENDDNDLSIYNIWEREITDYCKQNIKSGDVVIDIGANIGYYTLLFSNLIGKDGRVYSFEADEDNFDLLRKNVDYNGCKNVIIENVAVLDKHNKKIKFFKSKDNVGSHNIFNYDKMKNGSIIDTICLDTYFKSLNKKIRLIKMDIEGSEYKALIGMKKIIEKQKELIIITEFNKKFYDFNKIDPVKFYETLKSFGFKIFYFNDKKITKINNCLEINEIFKKKPSIDLLCIKG